MDIQLEAKVFDFFTALGEVAIAFAGHNVVLEIQATRRGVLVAYFIVTFPVALIGYWIFGNNEQDNILVSLEKPAWLIAAANMFGVVIHVIGSYLVPQFHDRFPSYY
ncbi:hypothetical protein ABFS82_08G001900 [Erythranthe guttata]